MLNQLRVALLQETQTERERLSGYFRCSVFWTHFWNNWKKTWRAVYLNIVD